MSENALFNLRLNSHSVFQMKLHLLGEWANMELPIDNEKTTVLRYILNHCYDRAMQSLTTQLTADLREK